MPVVGQADVPTPYPVAVEPLPEPVADGACVPVCWPVRPVGGTPLAAVRDHVRGFADMMLQLRGERLEQWMNDVRACLNCAPSSPACTVTSTRQGPGSACPAVPGRSKAT
ncbi:hypothetical protein [Planomonospora algeriensis]